MRTSAISYSLLEAAWERCGEVSDTYLVPGIWEEGEREGYAREDWGFERTSRRREDQRRIHECWNSTLTSLIKE